MKFHELIQAFRTLSKRKETQHDITARAVTFKRQLESVGMFPGLQRGTPQRLHKNVVDGKTRGERKREARAKVNAAILAAREPGIVVGYDFKRAEVDPVYAETGVRSDRYEVGEIVPGPGFVIIDRGLDRSDDVVIAGPYGRRSTANRRARQLNDG